MMSELPWIERHATCASELTLDRLHLGELRGLERRQVEDHITRCHRCQERAALREAGLTAFPGLEKILGRIQASPPVASPPPPPPGVRRALPKAATTLAVVTAVLLGVWPIARGLSPEDGRPRSPAPTAGLVEESPDVVTRKGSPRLRVFRERAGKVRELMSGQKARRGDRLRFKASFAASQTWEETQLMIVSLAASGARYVYHPADGSRASSRPVLTGDGALTGAIELDDAPEPEWLHLIVCPRPFSFSQIEAPGEPSEPEIPAGCTRTSFLVGKESKG